MKFALSALKEFFTETISAQEVADKLTNLGLESEVHFRFENFVFAKILEVFDHPNASKLKVCKVFDGQITRQIVCGASNARAGIGVVLAKPGAVMPSGLLIQETTIRSIKSEGMLCSQDELSITGFNSDGIIEISPNLCGQDFDNDPFIEVAITPNRGDCLSILGIARELGAKTDIKDVKSNDGSFSYAIIKGVKNHESDAELKSLLNKVGVKPISFFVDVTNYIMYYYGQPMHAYDFDKIKGKLRMAKGIEGSMVALDGKKYVITKDDIVIIDDEKICAIAGVIGSQDTACSLDTKNIILEAAAFDPVSITYTTRRTTKTDSSYRFERGIDESFIAKALNIAIDKIGVKPSEVEFNANKNIKKIECTENLVDEIFEYEKIGQKIFAIIPPWRNDINIVENIYEEIVRKRNIIQSTPPMPLLNLKPIKYQNIQENFRRHLACNLREVITWSFMDSETSKLFFDVRDDLVIKNPILPNLNYMRQSIIPNLIDIFDKNLRRSFKDINIFEIGPVYGDSQRDVVSILRSGTIDLLRKRNVDLYDLKAEVDKFGHFETSQPPKFIHPNKGASLIIDGEVVGYYGQIHPKINNNEIYVAEIFVDKISISKNQVQYSDYQIVERDISISLGLKQNIGPIIDSIKGDSIKEVKVFDIYNFDDKKSVGIRIKIQDQNKTLSDKEISSIMDEIIMKVSLIGGKLR